jgi:hypothetical protein
MKKNISLSVLSYEMLLELSKRSRKKPDEYLEMMIKENFYKSNKR